MSTTSCPHEEAVLAAARSGEWGPELKAHRESCMACAELTLVVAALAADAEELEAIDASLPDSTSIWLRASLASRERDFQRATRAIVSAGPPKAAAGRPPPITLPMTVRSGTTP